MREDIAVGAGEQLDEFVVRLCKEILCGVQRYYGDNTDVERFGGIAGRTKDGLKRNIIKYWSRWTTQRLLAGDLLSVMGEEINDYMAGLSALYNLLADGESKSLLVKLFAFRILGKEHIKLPLNTPEYWAKRKYASSLAKGAKALSANFLNWKLYLFALDEMGYPLKIYLTPMAVCARFMIRSYEYRNGTRTVKAEKSDHVIDAGGCWGDTALYFAHEVGENGMVYTFEFIPGNLAIMETNLALNSYLKERVKVVRNPLWERSREKLYFTDKGPGSTVSRKQSREKDSVTTVTIDDYVEENGIERIDFIKMDIEGAELAALKGAVRTLRRFRPKLAISLYHHPSDFVTIPQFLSSLELGYEFYLGHYTIHAEETVLFADLSERNSEP